MAFQNKDLATYTGPLAFGVYTISSVVYDIIPNSLVFGASGGTATEVSLTAGLPVQPQTGATWAVTDNGGSLTVDGSVSVSSVGGTVAVSGPLTDAELRAAPVEVVGLVGAVQSGAWTVSATQSGPWTVGVSGTVAVSGPLTDAELRASAVPVSLASVPTHAVTQSGTWTVTGEGGTFPITDNGGSITVDGTVAVTGTFWQATQPVSVASLPLPFGAATSAKQPTLGTAGTASADVISIQGVALMTPVAVSDNGGSLTVDGTVSVSGSVAVTGTFWQATQPVSAVSLPLPSGASTAAKQPAIGTAGTASADVITVQGIASMTAIKVDGSAVTQPVSGTFWQATQPVSLASVPSHAVTNAGTFAVQAAQSGTWSVRAQDGSGNNLTSATRGSERALSVQIVDAAGSQVTTFGGGAQYTEDAAAASDPTGTVPILVRADTPSAVASADGDNVAQRGTNYGAAYVQLVTSTGAFIDSVGGGTQYAEGATAATITGTAVMWEDASDTLRAASVSKPMPVCTIGGGSVATGKVNVTTSATLICAARTGRKRITISISTTFTNLYIGDSGVSTSAGYRLQGSAGSSIQLETSAAIYGITSATSVDVFYIEEY